jgi:hypothetical protein
MSWPGRADSINKALTKTLVSSMNLDRSPFLRPRWASKLRTAVSVSFDTVTVQRLVLASIIGHPGR